ncbi:MAG: 3-methyl-2-oxobutanoate hydroxymethyltransferase [Gammaproteobacteria bacterium]|nr:3-methyl-2-oxobutanoate hydroxymethyltransferase [Gammaproteobacteria bacterium]
MITINSLNKLKQQGEKIAVLTSYDASFAKIAENAGVEVILVGDSLGMVVQGQGSTVPVTMDHMVYHTACVTRGVSKAFVIADMPFMSHASDEQALLNAARLMQEGGAQMVKLEGAAELDLIKKMTAQSIPVCGHLGLLPQSIHQLGGYHVQGKDKQDARKIFLDAEALEEAGAQLLVVECVPAELAKEISKNLKIPVIGIGAGVDVDGQVLVLYDMLGMNSDGLQPRFVKDFLAEAGSIDGAIRAYVQSVKDAAYPGREHSY